MALERVRELRYLTGTTFNTTFTAASNAAWAAGTAEKLRILSFEDGTTQNSEEDTTLESQAAAGRAPIPLERGGEVKFSTWAEGGEADTSANPAATLMSKCMGGIVNPAAARSDAADSSGVHTTTRVYASGIESNVSVGQGVLVGTRGDARGNIELRPVSDTGTDYFDVPMAYSDAPDDSDAILACTTVHFDPTATQAYEDFLAIGASAEDQLQAIGCVGTFGLESLGATEAPKVSWTFSAGDWQEVPSGERDQLEPGSAAQGNDPATVRGMGLCAIGDKGSTTRAVFRVTDVSVDPGFSYEAIPGPHGVNGREGWQLVVGRPKIELTVLLQGGADPLPGFQDDFAAGTAKQVILQWGTVATRIFGLDFPEAYVSARPMRTAAGVHAAVKVTLEAATSAVDSETTANYLAASAMRVHFA